MNVGLINNHHQRSALVEFADIFIPKRKRLWHVLEKDARFLNPELIGVME